MYPAPGIQKPLLGLLLALGSADVDMPSLTACCSPACEVQETECKPEGKCKKCPSYNILDLHGFAFVRRLFGFWGDPGKKSPCIHHVDENHKMGFKRPLHIPNRLDGQKTSGFLSVWPRKRDSELIFVHKSQPKDGSHRSI